MNNFLIFFYIDYIFNEKHTNENLFTDLAKPILDSVIQGYNGTIFAYGQTSSGKRNIKQRENIFLLDFLLVTISELNLKIIQTLLTIRFIG